MVRFFCDNSHSPFISGLNFARKKDDYQFLKIAQIEEKYQRKLVFIGVQ